MAPASPPTAMLPLGLAVFSWFCPILHGNLQKTGLGSLCWSKNGTTETLPAKNFFGIVAYHSFLTVGASLQLAWNETRNTKVKKVTKMINEKELIRGVFESQPPRLGRALLAFFTSPFGLLDSIWVWRGSKFNFKRKRKKILPFRCWRWLWCSGNDGRSFSPATGSIFGCPSSSYMIFSLAARVRVSYENEFKYSFLLKLGLPFEEMWLIFSRWIILVWRINLNRMI